MIVRAWIDDSDTLRCASQVCSSEQDCPRWSGCKWYEARFNELGTPTTEQILLDGYKVIAREAERVREVLHELEAVLRLCYRALTEGMADVPAEGRDARCARLRAEAKREIRRVLGMVASNEADKLAQG